MAALEYTKGRKNRCNSQKLIYYLTHVNMRFITNNWLFLKKIKKESYDAQSTISQN